MMTRQTSKRRCLEVFGRRLCKHKDEFTATETGLSAVKGQCASRRVKRAKVKMEGIPGIALDGTESSPAATMDDGIVKSWWMHQPK
jgi:hypothetical protein